MRWLVTGGCGFIGRNLIRALRADDDAPRVRVLDDLSVGTEAALGEVTDYARVDAHACDRDDAPVQLVVADVADRDRVAASMRGVDVVVHLAARTGVIPSVEDPFGDCRVNVLGTLGVLAAARDVGARVVFASSGAPLGEQQPPLHERMAPRPVSPYGASKLAGEAYCSAFSGSYGLSATALRFSNVYGPLSSGKDSVVARWIKRALAGEPLVIYGDGEQTRDYLFVEDLAACLIMTGRAPALASPLFQVGTGVETTINQLVALLRDELEPHVGAIRVEHAPPRAGEVHRNYVDPSAIVEQLGWRAQRSLRDGLRVTVDWFVGR